MERRAVDSARLLALLEQSNALLVESAHLRQKSVELIERARRRREAHAATRGAFRNREPEAHPRQRGVQLQRLKSPRRLMQN